jgi:hypothetical protein
MNRKEAKEGRDSLAFKKGGYEYLVHLFSEECRNIKNIFMVSVVSSDYHFVGTSKRIDIGAVAV